MLNVNMLKLTGWGRLTYPNRLQMIPTLIPYPKVHSTQIYISSAAFTHMLDVDANEKAGSATRCELRLTLTTLLM